MPKREKAKILAAMQSSKAKSIESKVVAEMSDERRLIDTVVRAHYDTCDYTADKIGPFIQKAQNKQKLTQCTGQVGQFKKKNLMDLDQRHKPKSSFDPFFSPLFLLKVIISFINHTMQQQKVYMYFLKLDIHFCNCKRFIWLAFSLSLWCLALWNIVYNV